MHRSLERLDPTPQTSSLYTLVTNGQTDGRTDGRTERRRSSTGSNQQAADRASNTAVDTCKETGGRSVDISPSTSDLQLQNELQWLMKHLDRLIRPTD